jgi:hypothetical protein
MMTTTTQRVAATSALILSLAAAGAPTAGAGTQEMQSVSATTHTRPAAVYSRQDKSIIPGTSPSTSAASIVNGRTPQAVVRIQTPPSGFDWGDAGIGAAGGIALALLGVGGALVISQRRPQRTRRGAAQPN